MSKAVRKTIEEAKETGNPELDLQDKQITSLEDIPGLCKFCTSLLDLTSRSTWQVISKLGFTTKNNVI